LKSTAAAKDFNSAPIVFLTSSEHLNQRQQVFQQAINRAQQAVRFFLALASGAIRFRGTKEVGMLG